MNSVSLPNCFLVIAVGIDEFVARSPFSNPLHLGMRWKYRCLSVVNICRQGRTHSAPHHGSPVTLADVGPGLPSPEGRVNAVWT